MATGKLLHAARAPARRGGWRETARFIFVVFLVALAIRSFIAAPFSIPSGSMLPRLMIGDYLIVAKWPYGYAYPFGIGEGRWLEGAAKRGDVAVFRHPATDEDYVKRIVGLPGDRITMRGGILLLNGTAVPRIRIADYLMPISANSPCRTVDPEAARIVADASGAPSCAYARYRETLPGGKSYDVLDQIESIVDDTPDFTVPAGHYFVMGDNRDDSEDSRFPREEGGVGMLPADRLVGRALITFFSTDGSAEWSNPMTWLSATRWHRIGETF